VPATERAFTELPPSRLYLDTNIYLDYLIASRPHHQPALRLFQHLTAHGLTTLYLSSLSWIEFTHVATSQRFGDGLSPQWQRQYRLADWQQPMVRQAYLRVLLGRLQALLDQFGWSEVAVNMDVRIRALQYVAL
jgi:predicted nucleic acid-binding protein